MNCLQIVFVMFICYSIVGDEYFFVEVLELMLLEVFFCVMVIMCVVEWLVLFGVFDVCLVNVFFQICFDFDLIYLFVLLEQVKVLESSIMVECCIDMCIIEVLVLYDDFWINEIQVCFCDCYQDFVFIDL